MNDQVYTPGEIIRALLAAQKSDDRDWRELLDERQRKELEFSQVYRSQFHHGTTGHNQLMLIAYLGGLIDFILDNFELVEKDA